MISTLPSDEQEELPDHIEDGNKHCRDHTGGDTQNLSGPLNKFAAVKETLFPTRNGV